MKKIAFGILITMSFFLMDCATTKGLTDPQNGKFSLAFGGLIINSHELKVTSVGIRPVGQLFGLQQGLKVLEGNIFVATDLAPGRYYIETIGTNKGLWLVETLFKNEGWIFEVRENEITSIGSRFLGVTEKSGLLSGKEYLVEPSPIEDKWSLEVLNRLIQDSQGSQWVEKLAKFRDDKYGKGNSSI